MAQENSFSRRDIILAAANQDGGAHVDPSLAEKPLNYVKVLVR